MEIHARVDTTKNEIREIATIWTKYITSKPDKISDSPYWNKEEKAKHKNFDLSRRLLYQFPSDQLLIQFKPKILSIEKEGEHYCIRTIYSADGLEGEFSRSDPWAIQRLYAVKENDQWKLKNSLPIVTADWNRKTVGKITFIYSPDHEFNEDWQKKQTDFAIKS